MGGRAGRWCWLPLCDARGVSRGLAGARPSSAPGHFLWKPAQALPCPWGGREDGGGPLSPHPDLPSLPLPSAPRVEVRSDDIRDVPREAPCRARRLSLVLVVGLPWRLRAKS